MISTKHSQQIIYCSILFISLFSIMFGISVVEICAKSVKVIADNPTESKKILIDNWKFHPFNKKIKSPPQQDINVKKHSGNKSLQLNGNSGVWKTSFPVIPGKAYKISFKYKAKVPNNNTISRKMYAYLTKDSKTVFWMQGKTVKNQDEWTLVNLGDYVAKPNETRLSLNLKFSVKKNDSSTVWFDNIQILETKLRTPAKLSYLSSQGLEKDFVVWGADPNRKVFKNDPIPADSVNPETIVIKSAKRETEPFQIIITPKNKLNNVSWKWEDFKGPKILPKERLTYFKVEYVNIKSPSSDYGHKGLNPDPLLAEKTSILLPNENTPFWFIIDIPDSTPAGIYHSTLSLYREKEKIYSTSLELKVWNFTIPKQPTIKVDSNLWLKQVMDYESYDYKNKEDRLIVSEKYYKNIASHRASMGPPVNIPVKIVKNTVYTDTSEFENHLAVLKKINDCENIRIYNMLNIFPKKTSHRWPSNSSWRGIPIFLNNKNTLLNPEFIHFFSTHVLHVMASLKKMQCHKSPYVKFFDEPDTSHPPTVNALTNIAKLLKAIAPNINLTGSGKPHPDFITTFDRWDFNVSDLAFHNDLFQLAVKQKKAWVYDNTIPLVDLPLLRSRLFPWILWKEKVEGTYAWWSITYWKKNPWRNLYKNGKGSLLYPPKKRGSTGPVTSLRWETLRQGLEDYEYLNLLEALIKEKKGYAQADSIASAKLSLNQVNKLVDRFSVGANDQPYTLDTSLLADTRDSIARSIELLQTHKEMPPPKNLRLGQQTQ